MTTEFTHQLEDLAKRLVETAPHCTSEEAVKFSLVAPMIKLLGWEPSDPREVKPEHAIDFSEKYRNRVDFAIFSGDVPVIAIECKSLGNAKVDDRGQLKAYFNAGKTVRVGALTDGLLWEFFADSDDPNILDDKPFLVVDLRQVAQSKAPGSVFDALFKLTKAQFDPDLIGAEASRRLLFQGFSRQIAQLFAHPSTDFCRLLMKAEGVKHVRENRMAEYQGLVKQALRAVMDSEILARLNIPVAPPSPVAEAPVQQLAQEESKIETTAIELETFMWARMRLAYLVKDEGLYQALDKLAYRDFSTRFVVYWEAERRGRLFEFYEGRGKHKYVFATGETVETNDRQSLDTLLLSAYQNAVSKKVG